MHTEAQTLFTPNKAAQWFVGVALSPSENFESGLVILDRNKHIVRLDKFVSHQGIIQTLESLGDPGLFMLAVDIPKNIAIPGRFRYEEIRMHALRLRRPEGTQTRVSERLHHLVQPLAGLNIEPVLLHTSQLKQALQIQTPFRSRSSSACRQLQLALKQELGIQLNNANLVAATILDAMLGAYAAWTLWAGEADVHYSLEAASQWPGMPEDLTFYRGIQKFVLPVKSFGRRRYFKRRR